MNWYVLLNWVTLILGPVAIVLMIAFLATGRTNTTLRVLGGVALLLAMVAFGLTRFVLTPT